MTADVQSPLLAAVAGFALDDATLPRSALPAAAGGFSLDAAMLGDILEHSRPIGHHEDPGRLNLGFGFLYYALARSLRPRHIVVIGSAFGFSVVCLGLALRDNGAGQLTFVHRSQAMCHGRFKEGEGASHWDDPAQVRAHFARYGLEEVVTHFSATSADFFDAYEEHGLPPIDMGFIDGNHAFGQVRQDFIDVTRHTHRNSYLLMHDTNLQVRELIGQSGVRRWLQVVKRDRECFEVVNFPFSSGVALVRVLRDGPWHPAG